MKKVIICLIVILLIPLYAGCQKGVDNTDRIKYDEGVYPRKDWENLEVAVEEKCVSNKNTAISIGNAILLNFQDQGYFPNYVLQTVFYDTEDEIWILSFWEDNVNYPGSDFCIAINKSDGRVIKMWVGE